MKARVLTAALAALSIAAGAGAQPGEVDYSRLIPAPAEELKAYAAATITLSDAIARAKERTGGTAVAAWLELDDGAPVYIVTLLTQEARHTAKIHGVSGEVRSVESSAGSPIPGWALPEGAELVTTPTGLQYYEIVVGEGPQPAGPATRVNVHYSGYLVDGTKFDSSVDRGQPIVFPLNGVITGWTEGVGSMKVGGKRKLIIPFSLAYGEAGRPPVMPARAMLVFDVELISLP